MVISETVNILSPTREGLSIFKPTTIHIVLNTPMEIVLPISLLVDRNADVSARSSSSTQVKTFLLFEGVNIQ
jgi:hypothetical protein